jgi:metallophosphoesterase (TIGR00282 family)
LRVLFLGDIIGRSGRQAVAQDLKAVRERLALDFVVANGENAAAGFGITPKICEELYAAGVDVITTGNHVWDQKEIIGSIGQDKRLLRPINFPTGTPGRGLGEYTDLRGRKVVVINAMGRTFMDPLEDPFAAISSELTRYILGRGAQFTLIDFHGEATSEKMAMGHYLDGKVSMVVGTHSHVPTADAQILDGGTAYQTDAGMCGDYNSVIGMEKAEPLQRFTRKIPGGRFTPALGEATLCGVFVESDDKSGLAKKIAPLRLGGRLSAAWPD